MMGLDDIVGQDAAVARLRRTLAGGRRPHAFLFAGPEGVGRQTTASAMARLLLCEAPQLSPQRVAACGSCHSCRTMAAGTHPDYHLVYKELAAWHDDPGVRRRVMQELSIDVIRQFLMAPAYQASTVGRGKVFVVLDAELMSNAAQNALLKTLEEPPPGVSIILICQRPEQLLPTTLSRCWLVRFGYLPREFVRSRLEAEGVDPSEADFWAALTEGSIGKALELARLELYPVKRHIVEQLGQLTSIGNADLGEELARTMDSLAEQAVAASRKSDGSTMSKNLASRQAAGMLLELLSSIYRDALHLTAAAEADPPEPVELIHSDQPEAIGRIAQRLEAGQLAEILEQLSQFERLLWRNVNPKLVWDNVVITCATAMPLQV